MPEFNIDSPKQLGEVIFGKLNLDEKAKKTKTGQYKTDEATLNKLNGTHPIISDILNYRTRKKLLSTYVDALPKLISPVTNKIHTNYMQAVTSTGRLSSNKPWKQIFIFHPDYFIGFHSLMWAVYLSFALA